MTLAVDLLARVTSEVLEDGAFVFADPDDGSVPPADDPIVISLDFTGAECGLLAMHASRTFATELAANLLGLEPDAEEARAGSRDALAELLNILAGVLMNEWLGPDEYKLGLPASHTLGDALVSTVLIADGEHRIEVSVHAPPAS